MSLTARFRRFARRRERLLAAVLAVVAGLVVFWLAAELFPYHSSNHDEGVYLQQAELLLGGQLQFRPGGLTESLRPWFFVEADGRLYPKYQPLPAAFFAAGMALFGEPRVVLALVAAGNAALVYTLGSAAFDRSVGVLAAVAFGFAPMTLLTSAVFLAYAPTTLFNLAFAVLYLRARRTGRVHTAALAGAAVGIAFFTRPFTAVLFAAPFVGHALWEIVVETRELHDDGDPLRSLLGCSSVRRQLDTAVVGLGFVGLTLGYNAVVTGDPLLFAYEAFAPQDGPGFGERRILDYSVEYTPGLALRANGYALWYLLTRWVFAGVLGAALAVVGLVAAARRYRLHGDHTAQVLLASLFVAVPVGNLFFWGNYNVLATPADPTDGLVSQFGPFYHFDLLAPVAVFAAAGSVALWRTLRPRIDTRAPSPAVARGVAVTLLVVTLLLVGAANAAVLTEPIERNAAHTETYEQAYEPFETHEFENAVVFLPTPYGNWLNHPFQYLRNDPGLDGRAVYALDQGPASDFDVVEAYPNRSLYRYEFRGEWTPNPATRRAVPKIDALTVHSGEQVAAETVVGVPDGVNSATVRIETAEGALTRYIREPAADVRVNWSVGEEQVTLAGLGANTTVTGTVERDQTDEVVVLVRLSQSGAGTLTYRQAVSVRTTEGGVAVVWPPERTVCPRVDDCGHEGTYIAEEAGPGISFETRVVG